jgi:DNA-binding winged helix-turn-helix (wHTH) protein
MEATQSGMSVTLTAQEFKLLNFFVQSPGGVLFRDELFNELWGYQNYPSTLSFERTVDNPILRLRQKLEPDSADPRYFLTISGAGHKFVPGPVNVATGVNTRARAYLTLQIARRRSTKLTECDCLRSFTNYGAASKLSSNLFSMVCGHFVRNTRW